MTVKKTSTQEKLRMMQMQGKVKASSSISVGDVSVLSCWLKRVILLHIVLPAPASLKAQVGNMWLLMEVFRMGWGEMGNGSWQGCRRLAAPALCISANASFETCFVRPTSPHRVRMMGILHFYRTSLKVFNFLSRDPLTFHVTFHVGTCSANLKAELHIR